VDIETEFAGEFDAIAGDVDRMKTEVAAEKEAEITDLKAQLEEAKDEGRKDGAATAIAIVKRRLGIF
jgi:polysaccharide deacetylase 2 family uncharacterized protein YibQ